MLPNKCHILSVLCSLFDVLFVMSMSLMIDESCWVGVFCFSGRVVGWGRVVGLWNYEIISIFAV